MNDRDVAKPEVQVFDLLLEHPVPPAPLSDVVAAGEARLRRGRHRRAFVAVVGILAVTAGSAAAVQTIFSHERLHNAVATTTDTATIGTSTPALDCPSEFSGSGTFDLAIPESTAQAREEGWPATADEAARKILSAPAFVTLAHLTLSEGVAVDLPGAAKAIRYYAVDDDGATLAILTAEELIPDVWAITQLERCA